MQGDEHSVYERSRQLVLERDCEGRKSRSHQNPPSVRGSSCLKVQGSQAYPPCNCISYVSKDSIGQGVKHTKRPADFYPVPTAKSTASKAERKPRTKCEKTNQELAGVANPRCVLNARHGPRRLGLVSLSKECGRASFTRKKWCIELDVLQP